MMKNPKQYSLLSFFFLALISMFLLMPLPSRSQEYNITNFHGKKATTEQLIKALKPETEENLEFRSLGIGGSKKALADASKKAASLELKFEFDSYQLTEIAKDYLDQLGQALRNQELAQYKFLVEGHTDSQGGDDYNLSLSEKRALAVKQYLITNFDIDPVRLTAIGRGENDLLDKNFPENPLNRRVQVVNVE